jgi:hypothetical protein
MKQGFLKTACVTLVALLALASCAAAQTLAKKNLTRADRDAWYKILRWPTELEDDWRKANENSNYGGLNFYGLGRGKYLVEVKAYAVAYQSGFVYMIYDERTKPNGPERMLLLKGFESSDEGGNPLPYSMVSAAFAKFHAKTRVLEIYSKFRAQGDCGLYVRYRFVGTRPVVVEARGRDCDDDGRPGLQDYSRWPRKKL